MRPARSALGRRTLQRPRPFVLLLLSAPLSLSCAAPPRGPWAALTRFPIGIYQVDDPKHLRHLREDGFDSILPYGNDPAVLGSLAREARRLGMRLVASPDLLRNGPVSVTGDWPVDAWYLFDEPDVAKLSSTTLQNLSERTRAWDPARPQAFVIGEGAPARTYAGIGDILMLDWYPVPHKPTDSIADQIDLAMRYQPRGKPFWMVVQAYDWADEVKDPVKRKGLRFPTHSEIRFMSYLAVLHGARGLFYFAHSKKRGTLFDYPELWQAVARVSREMRSMKPLFERGSPVQISTPLGTGGLEGKAWRFRGRDYLVLANRNGKVAQRVPRGVLGREWRPLYETRRDVRDILKAVEGEWHLEPYEVIVMESRIRWRSLIRRLPSAELSLEP